MKTQTLTLLVAAIGSLLLVRCSISPHSVVAHRVENLESFIVELEAKAIDPKEKVNWEEADAAFNQLYQPSLQSTVDRSLSGYRKSQDYLAGRYAALRVRNATIDELHSWVTSKTEQWQGFIEGLEDS